MDLAYFTSPEIWLSFLTLSVLEIVLGIDNVIFLSLVSSRLPKHLQKKARQIGLFLALFARVALLASISWLTKLTEPLTEIMGFAISGRDLVLFGGGLFLIVKATMEIHEMMEESIGGEREVKVLSFTSAIIQIVILDIVFSLDSVITAVGLANDLPVMIAAIVVAIIVMLVASESISRFIDHHPTVKMLALAFLMLVGMALVADGLHFHIPRGYLYFAIAFSISVEALNLVMASRRKRAQADMSEAPEQQK